MTIKELSRTEIELEAKRLNLQIAKKYDLTIEEMIKMQSTMSSQEEGFVVLFENSLRLKIKSNEYLRISKILNSVSPLSIWDALTVGGKVDEKYLRQIPEEILQEVLDTEKVLHEKYITAWDELLKEITTAPVKGLTLESDKKVLGLWLQSQSNLKYSRLFFPFFLGRVDVIHKAVKEAIRPTGNLLA